MSNTRVYLRAVGDRGQPFRKLGAPFDGDVSVGFWSRDGGTIYFNEGIRATNQLIALDVATNTVRPVTQEKASLSVDRDEDSGVLLITYADGATPPTLFTVDAIEKVECARRRGGSSPTPTRRCAAWRSARRRRSPGRRPTARWSAASWSSRWATRRASAIR